ncbi:PREDICTED: RNA-binding protein cabeza-like isoform X2 [Priapulus caudatus]|uniref:RNA-binding protein cabeza-like isoform X2 n=1 Tax=Priapulus caudatus TaxID=37621 RepID=A0ABM1EXR1_PRICU|nr:PREDICTED: RNA-binding protein cabeza-like isoform X2 [Priapulus caudatus]
MSGWGEEWNRDGGGRRDDRGGGYGGGGGGGGGFSRNSGNDGGAAGPMITMMVNNRDLGRIIGKGGCKIRELQDNSSARINIRKDDSDGRETPVDLIGSPDSTCMVKGMIEELLQLNTRGYGDS